MQFLLNLLPSMYFPRHAKNRMGSEGDLRRARAEFLLRKHNNLQYLLKNRYEWMNDFINRSDIVVEVGAGAGFSQQFIKTNVIITEISPYQWIDICVDGMNLPFGMDKIDVLICVNVLHHFAHPIKFLIDVHRCLKSGGHVLIFEPNPSLLLLLALRLMRHEGWSFDVDAFDPSAPVNDPADPWSGNNAISDLIFCDRLKFQENVPGLEVVLDRFTECTMFPLSGGVTAKAKTIELPTPLLKIVDSIDRLLCRLSPKIFAMGRAVVLRKRDG